MVITNAINGNFSMLEQSSIMMCLKLTTLFKVLIYHKYISFPKMEIVKYDEGVIIQMANILGFGKNLGKTHILIIEDSNLRRQVVHYLILLIPQIFLFHSNHCS